MLQIVLMYINILIYVERLSGLPIHVRGSTTGGASEISKAQFSKLLKQVCFSLRVIPLYWSRSHYVQNKKFFLVDLSLSACFHTVIEIINLIGVMRTRTKGGQPNMCCIRIIMIAVPKNHQILTHTCTTLLEFVSEHSHLMTTGQPGKKSTESSQYTVMNPIEKQQAHRWLNQCC